MLNLITFFYVLIFFQGRPKIVISKNIFFKIRSDFQSFEWNLIFCGNFKISTWFSQNNPQKTQKHHVFQNRWKNSTKWKFMNGNFNLICFFVLFSCFPGFFADEKFICNEQGNHLFSKKIDQNCEVVFHSFFFFPDLIFRKLSQLLFMEVIFL
jgi:hypothetical protein